MECQDTASWEKVEERAVTTSGSWSEALAAQYLWGGQYLDELVAFEVDGNGDGAFDNAAGTNAVVWHDALYSAVAVLSAKSGAVGGLLGKR